MQEQIDLEIQELNIARKLLTILIKFIKSKDQFLHRDSFSDSNLSNQLRNSQTMATNQNMCRLRICLRKKHPYIDWLIYSPKEKGWFLAPGLTVTIHINTKEA